MEQANDARVGTSDLRPVDGCRVDGCRPLLAIAVLPTENRISLLSFNTLCVCLFV